MLIFLEPEYHSAKLRRALLIQDQCEHELKQVIETNKKQKSILSTKSDLVSAFCTEQDAVDGRSTIGIIL
jgi:hypothetical protein